MIIALDSLKFYKLKNENTARILFLIVYALFVGFYALPVGEPIDANKLLSYLQGETTDATKLITISNIIYLLLQFGCYLITSFIALIYANCYVMEAEGFPSKKAVLSSIRKLPGLIGYLLLMIAPVAISSVFCFIPLVYLIYAMFFVPIMITEGKKGIIEAMMDSFRATRGIKFSIFFTQVMIYFVINIPISIFASLFLYTGLNDTLPEYLVLAFLSAAYTLMGGRMLGNFYLLVVKNAEKKKNLQMGIFRKDTDPENRVDENDGENDDHDEEDGDEDSERKE